MIRKLIKNAAFAQSSSPLSSSPSPAAPSAGSPQPEAQQPRRSGKYPFLSYVELGGHVGCLILSLFCVLPFLSPIQPVETLPYTVLKAGIFVQIVAVIRALGVSVW